MKRGIKKLQWEGLTPTYGKLIVEPFKKGFATTIGNSLRRVLLSGISGAAVTSIKVDGLLHEFTTIPGIVEDPIDLILNIRGIVFKYNGNEKKGLYLKAKKGKVTAGMIKTPVDVEIVNPEHYLATVSDGEINIEMELESGIGYLPADESKREKRIGTIPIDAYFSPIKRVNFQIEDVRIGRITDYERLVLEITTNGAMSPKEAVVKAALILADYISIFQNPEPFVIEEERPEKADEEREKLRKILNTKIDELEISVRASNCLRMSGIIRIGDIVKAGEENLLKMKNFGRKSLAEIKEKLAEYNLTLGMEGIDDLLEPLPEEEIVTEHRAQNTEHRTQNTEHRIEGGITKGEITEKDETQEEAS